MAKLLSMISYTVPTILLMTLFSCSPVHQDIYEWRGENRSGVYPDTDLLKEWPEEGPKELWTLENLGRGYGSPLFVEDFFYITGEVDSLAKLYCFDLEGQKLWQTSLGKEWVTSFPGSRSAPTVVDDLLYIGSGMGNLFCVNREDGTIAWSRDFAEDFQGQYPLHGHSEATVVKDDMVYWTPGGETHNVVALNRFSGELIWSQEQFGVSPEERDLGLGDTHANSVIFHKGSIYFAAGDGNRGVRLDLSEDGSEITEAWRNKGFDSFMGGVVMLDSHLYTSGTAAQYFKSIDASTGILTDSLKIGHGAVITADQMLYYYNQRGEMKLISFTEGKMNEVSSFKITKGSGHHFSHPVIYQGVLYQRRGDALMAYEISETTQ